MRASLATTAAVALAATSVHAQFDNAWVEFQKSPASLNAGTISSGSIETDVIWGDLDKDGRDDLVIVRKQPFTSAGKRTNILLMNEGEVVDCGTHQELLARCPAYQRMQNYGLEEAA